MGDPISHTDFNGGTTTFEYDEMDRLVKKNLPGGQVTYTYTATGQTETITDARGVTTFAYDLRGRLVGVENADGTTLSYDYDPAGSRTEVTTVAGSTFYTYDVLSRLATVKDPDNGITTYSYDAAGNRESIVYPNGAETHYTYDARNRLTRVQHTGPAGTPTLAQFDYTLGPTGIRTSLTESSGRVVGNTYDDLYRLTDEVDTNGGGAVTTTYTYDDVGNRLSMDRDGTVTTYSYDDNNRMTALGTEIFAYDANGNMTSRKDGALETVYTYDALNRLVSQMEPDSTTTTFTYDDSGNRVSRNADGVVTNFIVDPADNSGLPQVLVELDAADAIVAGYIYGDDLIRMQRGSIDSYYHYDGIGSTRLLTDSTGAVSDSYAYDAFGNVIAGTGTTLNDYLFTGEQLDPNLGFYYLRARYMSPEFGRFISADPFPGSVFDPPSLHKYSYVNNDPVNMVDPTGMFTLMSLSAAISIRSAITVAFIVNIIYNAVIKPAREVYKKATDLAKKLNTLKLNSSATQDELGFQFEENVNAASEAENIEGVVEAIIKVNLGEGVVNETYGLAEAMTNLGGKVAMTFWKFQAAYYLANLPPQDDIPGNYFACGFNRFVQTTFGLASIAGGSAALKRNVLSGGSFVLGFWLGYVGYLGLVATTVDDFAASAIPPQPADGVCNLPLAR